MRAFFFAVALPILVAAARPAAEQAAIFRAAGFVRHGSDWRSGNCEPPEASYSPGSVEAYGDLNGDMRPEAIVTEQGGLCYGDVGQNTWLLSKQQDGSWKTLAEFSGVAEIQKAKGAGGYPDILVGRPGFCFAVQRWNGRAYAVHHFEYEGKPCRPSR
jgi:hypothetical protein